MKTKKLLLLLTVVALLITSLACGEKQVTEIPEVVIEKPTKSLSELKLATILYGQEGINFFKNSLDENDIIIAYPAQAHLLQQNFNVKKALIADTANELIAYMYRVPGLTLDYLIYNTNNRDEEQIIKNITYLKQRTFATPFKLAIIAEKELIEKRAKELAADFDAVIIQTRQWQAQGGKTYSGNVSILANRLRKEKPGLEIFTRVATYQQYISSSQEEYGSNKMVELAETIKEQVNGVFVTYEKNTTQGMQYFVQKMRTKKTE